MHFVESVASRSKYKRFLYKAEDAENIKLLDVKLNQAFQLFLVSFYVPLLISLVNYIGADKVQHEYTFITAYDGTAH